MNPNRNKIKILVKNLFDSLKGFIGHYTSCRTISTSCVVWPVQISTHECWPISSDLFLPREILFYVVLMSMCFSNQVPALWQPWQSLRIALSPTWRWTSFLSSPFSNKYSLLFPIGWSIQRVVIMMLFLSIRRKRPRVWCEMRSQPVSSMIWAQAATLICAWSPKGRWITWDHMMWPITKASGNCALWIMLQQLSNGMQRGFKSMTQWHNLHNELNISDHLHYFSCNRFIKKIRFRNWVHELVTFCDVCAAINERSSVVTEFRMQNWFMLQSMFPFKRG